MFKIGLCQMMGSKDKRVCMEQAGSMIREAVSNGAQVVALPEMWKDLFLSWMAITCIIHAIALTGKEN